jgi:hypothetical protein
MSLTIPPLPPVEGITPPVRPFLIYLKKRGAGHPFFVMWVDNAELLITK